MKLATYHRATDAVQAVQFTLKTGEAIAEWMSEEYRKAFPGYGQRVVYDGLGTIWIGRGPDQDRTDPVPVPLDSWFVFRGLGDFIVHTPEEFEALYVEGPPVQTPILPAPEDGHLLDEGFAQRVDAALRDRGFTLDRRQEINLMLHRAAGCCEFRRG